MYPIPQSPIVTTSGFVPNMPSSTFKPIHPAAPSTASGQATQGSPMVDRAQETGPSPGSSIPCAQKSPVDSQPSPASTQGTSIQSSSTQVPQAQGQNVAQGQLFAMNTQAIQQLPVAPQQQSLQLQPPVPGSHAAPRQQGQPKFVQPRINPQGQPIRQQRQPSPSRQGFNSSVPPFIPAAEAQTNAVPNTPENKVPKSNGGQGVKSSAQDGQTCFRCKQPGHLKKDCPELPYCSRCHTRGHIPVKCPTKNKSNQQQEEKHKNGGAADGQKNKNCKQTQDQPQFSNPNNRCLHCAGDHRSHDCPMRHQHQAPPTNNAVVVQVQIHNILLIFHNLHPHRTLNRVSQQLDHQHQC